LSLVWYIWYGKPNTTPDFAGPLKFPIFIEFSF
jgi:hypothetical protein